MNEIDVCKLNCTRGTIVVVFVAKMKRIRLESLNPDISGLNETRIHRRSPVSGHINHNTTKQYIRHSHKNSELICNNCGRFRRSKYTQKKAATIINIS